MWFHVAHYILRPLKEIPLMSVSLALHFTFLITVFNIKENALKVYRKTVIILRDIMTSCNGVVLVV